MILSARARALALAPALALARARARCVCVSMMGVRVRVWPRVWNERISGGSATIDAGRAGCVAMPGAAAQGLAPGQGPSACRADFPRAFRAGRHLVPAVVLGCGMSAPRAVWAAAIAGRARRRYARRRPRAPRLSGPERPSCRTRVCGGDVEAMFRVPICPSKNADATFVKLGGIRFCSL